MSGYILGAVFSAVLLPLCVAAVFAVRKSSAASDRASTDERFAVYIPPMIAGIGTVCMFSFTVTLLAFTFFSAELPHVLFYVFFGAFFMLGLYLVVKTKTWRIMVDGRELTVYTALKKPFTVSFDEIAAVKRQVKNNRVRSERLVIQTADGRKIIAERMAIAYDRLQRKIRREIAPERLSGWD